MPALALALLGWGKLAAQGVVGWLSRRSLAEIAALVISIALVIDHLALLASHRHSTKVEAQLSKCTDARKADQAAFAQTVANYRAAAAKAAADDAANKQRVEHEQATINEGTDHDFQARIADARARAGRLRTGTPAANPGGGSGASVPGVPAPACRPAQSAGENGLPASDALTATEQAIQLDELIKWVRGQHAIDPNGAPK